MARKIESISVNASGIGFGGLLTLAFIVLKLCKVITWSWLWVLSPLWISTGLVLLIFLVYIIISLILRKQ